MPIQFLDEDLGNITGTRKHEIRMLDFVFATIRGANDKCLERCSAQELSHARLHDSEFVTALIACP